jgi:phosphoserine phosphatase RsbU/P
LLCEDDELIAAVLRIELQAMGYEPQVVGDGLQASERLQAEEFDILITDWRLPGRDGLAVIREARSRLGSDRYLCVIFMTGRANEGALEAGLSAGADHVLFKPLDLLEIRLTLKSAVRTLQLQNRLARRNHHLVTAHERMRSAFRQLSTDLEAAAAAQRAGLPKPGRRGCFQFDWLFAPAQQIGGDGFNVVQRDEWTLTLFALDISGHGIPVAFQSLNLQHALTQDALRPGTASLPARVAALNRSMCAGPSSEYATLLIVEVNALTGESEVVLAGHPPPLLWRAASGEVEALEEGDMPIGLFADASFQSHSVVIRPGDRLFIYSDGLLDARGPSEPFGEARLRELVRTTGAEPFDQITPAFERAAAAFRNGQAREDDISMLVLERLSLVC